MGIALANATDNIINTDGTGGITIASIISGSNKLTKTGAGVGAVLQLTAANTYTGLTTVSAGTLQLNNTGGGTLPSTNSVTVASGGTLKVTTNQTLSGLTVASGGTLVIDAGATLTVTGTSSIAGTLTLAGTLTNNGTMTITSSIAAAAGGIVQGTGASLTFGTGGTWAASTPSLTASAASNTVTYNGAGQTIKGTTYTSLTISGTGTKALNYGATVLNSDLTIPSGITFNTNSQALTFNGDYIFNGTASNFGSSIMTIGGTKTAQSIAGFTTTGAISMTKTAGTATFTSNVQGASLTINGTGGTLDLGTGLTHTMTITTSGNNGLVRTAGTLNGGSSTLKLAGNGSGSGATFNPGTGTVEYNSVDATAQTIATMTYNNLILTGANSKSLVGAATVNGNFTINTGATLAHSSTSILTLKGGFTNSGTYTATNTANVTFAGTTAQSITGTTPTFIGLTVATGATLNLTAAQTATTVTVNTGGILTTTATLTASTSAAINGTFQINQGGYATGGTWTYGSTATLAYNLTSNLYAIDGTHIYWPATSGPANVTVTCTGTAYINMGVARSVPSSGTAGTFLLVTGANAVQGTALTLNGTTQINGGNFQSTPTYGAASTLIYNVGTGVGYGANNEWTGNSTTAGSGIPFNVTIQSGNITLPNTDRGVAGSVTISAGSLILNGASGDLYVARNWTRDAAATFTPNNRAVFFVGGNAKTLTVTGGGTETFNYLRLGGSNTLQLTTGTNLAVNASSGTNLTLSSSNSTSTIDLNGQTLTVSGGGNMDLSAGTRYITSTLAGGTFIISGSDLALASGGLLVLGNNVTTQLNRGFTFTNNQITVGGGTSGVLQLNSGGFVSQPTYAAGSTLVYNNAAGYTVSSEWAAGTTTGNGVPNNVTVLQGTVILPNTARTVPSTLTMTSGALTLTNGGNLTVTSLVLNNTKITTNAAKVIIPASGTLTRGTGYVVGNLQKNVATGATTRTFEIGDATNYTPLSISFGNVTVAGDLTANVTASAHPNRGTSSLSSTKFVARYWTLTNSGTTFNNYAATFTYVNGDIQGSATPSALLVGQYAASAWTYPAVASTSSTSVTTTSSVTAFGDFFLGEQGCINPTAFNVTGGGAYCADGTGVTIGLSNSETGVTYQPILSGVNNGLSVTGTNSAISFGSRTTAGTYTVLATRTTGGCTTTMTGSATITVNPLPTAVTVSGGGTFCGSATLTASNGSSGTIYYQSTTTNGTSTATPSSSQAISSSGTYYFRAQSADGCWSTEGSAAVTVNPIPTITLGDNPSVCRGITVANLTYSATSNTPTQYSITYNGAATTAGFTNVSGTTLPTTPIVLTVPAAATAATYNATLTVNTANCVSAAANIAVTVNPNPTVTTDLKVDDVCMIGTGSVRLTVTGGTPAYTVTWTNNGAQSGTISASGGTLTVNNLSGPANYGFLVTDNNGCIAPQ